MDFQQLTLERASCRSYEDKAVEKTALDTILQAAAYSPSACNSQPWKFVACTDDMAKQLAPLMVVEGLSINKWANQASAFIVICETKAKLMGGLDKDSQYYAFSDIGGTAATIQYAASDLGLGSCILGSFQEKAVHDLLGIPADVKIRLIISIGYPKSDGIRPKSRKDMAEVISYNAW